MNNVKLTGLKVLHLSGNPKQSMALWSRFANRFDIPVDFAVAASPDEVIKVMGDYDIVMVASRQEWETIEASGTDMKKVFFEFDTIPQGLAARKPSLPKRSRIKSKKEIQK